MTAEAPFFIDSLKIMDVTTPDIREATNTRDRLRPNIEPLGLEGFFNPAVIDRASGTTLLARQVAKPAEYGQPDVGQLVQIDLAPDGQSYKVVNKNTIWSPEDTPGRLLEDVRAFQALDPSDRRISLGATVLMDRKVKGKDGVEKDEPTPYGAIAILDDESELSDAPAKFRPCPELGPGKNMTPLNTDGDFFFRQEGKENDLKLAICHYDQESDTIAKTGELDFRPFMVNSKWGASRIGTTGAPIQIGDKTVLIIHGIRAEKVPLEKNPDGKFYTYSLGLAVLDRSADGEWFVSSVDSEPMLEPADFTTSDGVRMGRQLHPELRDAIYSCGFREQGENLDLMASYGDTQTFIARYSKKELGERVKMLEERVAPALAA